MFIICLAVKLRQIEKFTKRLMRNNGALYFLGDAQGLPFSILSPLPWPRCRTEGWCKSRKGTAPSSARKKNMLWRDAASADAAFRAG
jgi:hypothetical protein